LIYGGGISSEHEAFLSVIAKKKQELKVLSEKVEPLILKCIEITEKKSYETAKVLGLNQHIKTARSQFREYQSLIMSYIQRPLKVEWFEQGYRI
jgi:hypothetical protein